MHALSLVLPMALAIAGAARGQGSVLVVDPAGGPGSFPTIGAAVGAASLGDTVLVKAGSYGGFTVRKPLAVVGEAGASVVVTGTVVVADTDLGQSVLLRDLLLDPGSGMDVRVRDCEGPVWLEHCSSRLGGRAPGGLQVSDSSLVVVNRCVFEGWDGNSGNGGSFGFSEAWVWESTFLGGQPSYPAVAGNGVWAYGSAATPVVLFFADSLLQGGCCSGNPSPGASGLLAQSTSGSGYRVELLDSLARAGSPGRPAITRVGAGTVASLPGAGRTFGAASPVRAGAAATLRLGGQPGDVALALFSTAPATAAARFPQLAGGVVVASPWTVVVLGTLGASGELQASFPVPRLPAAIDVVQLYAQAAGVGPTSGPWLGAATSLTVLNQSLD